ncbi:MAG: hypothetical protein V1798_07320 [Pseudomonadota bacterium]
MVPNETIDLRTYVYLDVLQPQLAGFLQTVAQGFQPLESQASLFVEIAPGISINEVTDVALKRTSVTPGMQIVERAFGLLELHSFDQGQVRQAGSAILEHYGLEESSRLKPKVLTSEIITDISGYQAMLINRMRHGDLILEGRTFYVMEVHPAGYAAFAANEAEKASPIHLLEMISFGAFGRLYLSGNEDEIAEAAKAAKTSLAQLSGRENPGLDR